MSNRADQAAATGERITLAAVDLFMERRFDDVTLADIAKAAGVSHQTVLNHFESKEGVAVAAAEWISNTTSSARQLPSTPDPAAAIRILVAEYERIGDANVQWAMDADRIAALAPFMDGGRANHRAWIEEAFDRDLPTDPKTRKLVVTAVYAATDVYTWKLLRRDLGLSRAATEHTMLHLVTGALADH